VRPASGSPSGSNANGSLPPLPCKHMPASRPCRNAAGSKPGCTGVSRVPSSCDNRAWRGPPKRSAMPSGPRSMTSRNARRGKRIRPLGGRSPGNGSASFIGVGKSAPRTRSPSLSRHALGVAHRCSTSLRRRPQKRQNPLTAPLRACVRLRAGARGSSGPAWCSSRALPHRFQAPNAPRRPRISGESAA
jgi:hypothetical protein